MRVLYLEHPNETFLSSQMWEGLSRLLGRENVIVFPLKRTFFGEAHDLLTTQWYRDVYEDLAAGYEMPLGKSRFSPGEYLTTNDERRFHPDARARYVHIPAQTQREYTEEEVVDTIDTFDFIVLSNTNHVPTLALARLRERVEKPLPPIVYLDPGERDEFNSHWWHVFRPAVCFKQSLTPGEFHRYPSAEVPCRLYPLPLGNPWVVQPATKYPGALDGVARGGRPIDVLCTHGISWEERRALQDRAATWAGRFGYVIHRFISMMDDGMPYFALLSQARVAVSMRGSTRDAERYWQIPAFGTLLLSDGTMGCVQPYAFRDGETAVFYRSLDELEQKLGEIFADEDRRIALAGAGQAHLRRFHSIEARALYLLGIVMGKLGLRYSDSQTQHVSSVRQHLGGAWTKEALPDWQTGPVVGYGLADWQGSLEYEG